MWCMCARLRKVVDVFIFNKKFCLGIRFGFVRFSGIRDVDLMITKLFDVWFGFYKLFASIPHIVKKDKRSNTIPCKIEIHETSYVSVVRGQILNNKPCETSEAVIVLESGDFIIENRRLLV